MQNNIQEAYVHRSADKKILTFYYDTLRAERDGTTWGIGETKEDSFSKYYAWTGTFESPNTSVLTAVFDASFREFRPTTTAGWFLCFPWLKSIEGLDYLNTSEVTDMSGMFLGCSSLTEIDFSHFDTSQVTNMNGVFLSDCASPFELQHCKGDQYGSDVLRLLVSDHSRPLHLRHVEGDGHELYVHGLFQSDHTKPFPLRHVEGDDHVQDVRSLLLSYRN